MCNRALQRPTSFLGKSSGLINNSLGLLDQIKSVCMFHIWHFQLACVFRACRCMGAWEKCYSFSHSCHIPVYTNHSGFSCHKKSYYDVLTFFSTFDFKPKISSKLCSTSISLFLTKMGKSNVFHYINIFLHFFQTFDPMVLVKVQKQQQFVLCFQTKYKLTMLEILCAFCERQIQQNKQAREEVKLKSYTTLKLNTFPELSEFNSTLVVSF